MRQIGDLIVGMVLVMVLAAAAYFTPRFAAYMSKEGREPSASASGRSLAFLPTSLAEDTN